MVEESKGETKMSSVINIKPPAPQDRPSLQKGDKGIWVVVLQHALSGCGHTIEVDGDFGAGTSDVVDKFQNALGLLASGSISGVVDTNTWTALDKHTKLSRWQPFWVTPKGDGRKVDRKSFFTKYRATTQFSSTLNQKQVEGYDAIFDYWENSTLNDLRWLAYALATAYHETGETIEPVREGFCQTDSCSISAVTNLFNRGLIDRNYALPHPNGNSYFGRGLVQLTHGFNYQKMGQAIGLGTALYDHPSLALDLDISVKIMLQGMVDGFFTTLGFSDFFNRSTDWVGARQIINGNDRAGLIAGYAQDFFDCLR
ncbi:peptidoglycan-binding protein [Kovacikia minuta CCNUW1]|uniref:peptidoglycan-binding protein n=1 Tax=Kovacikia minuta TaxID=2931930 RepID=UPI001CCD611D|nr:peptidoglycan-binding protein [Kovacikia minuta]UBF26694.1 peptidoglycan-binding protein [Kovacikia minuta CCNUW1]